MIDTHCHIDGEEFAEDLDAVIQRAKDSGIEKIFVPGITLNATQNLLDICARYPDYLYPMVGLHPENIMDEDYHHVLDEMEAIIARNVQAQSSNIQSLKDDANASPLNDATDSPLNDANAYPLYNIIGIGEIGLDLYWDDTYRNEQMEALDRQISWAYTYDLPLMFHVRKAHNEMMSIMRKHSQSPSGSAELRGVFHCFSGSVEMAREMLRYPNFCLGIGGILTFKNSKLSEVLKEAVPLDRIVLETDAPYMAPVPHRGKRNESAYVKEVAKRLAEIYEVTIEDIDRITSENALKIFQKAKN